MSKIIANIDPLVVLAYDKEYAVTRASRVDDFSVAVGRTRFYRSIKSALAGAAERHVDVDGSHASAAAIRRAGCVPVRWDRTLDGWVET